MNRHLSAFMLAARNVVYKALALSLAAAVVQLALLSWKSEALPDCQKSFFSTGL